MEAETPLAPGHINHGNVQKFIASDLNLWLALNDFQV